MKPRGFRVSTVWILVILSIAVPIFLLATADIEGFVLPHYLIDILIPLSIFASFFLCAWYVVCAFRDSSRGPGKKLRAVLFVFVLGPFFAVPGLLSCFRGEHRPHGEEELS